MHDLVNQQFKDRILNGLLPEFCNDPSHNYNLTGFKTDWQNVSDRDADDFLRGLDAGLIEHTGRGLYRAPRSRACEQFFWEGVKTVTPRSITLWIEPIITVAVLTRLHFDLGWPKHLMGTQSSDGAFDVVAYRESDLLNEFLACEIKKTSRELKDLIVLMKHFGSDILASTDALSGKELNAYRKVQALRSRHAPFFWAVGPDNNTHLFQLTYSSDQVVTFKEVQLETIRYNETMT